MNGTCIPSVNVMGWASWPMPFSPAGLLCGNYSLDMVRDHGKIPSWRRAAYYGRRHEEHAPTRSSPKLTERTVSAVAKLETWAAARGVTASQAATAWALSHPAVTSVLLGVSNCAQFDANLAALDLKLSDDEARGDRRVGSTRMCQHGRTDMVAAI